MAGRGPGVYVEGLDDLRRQLRHAAGELDGRALGRVNKTAAEYVVELTEQRGRALGGIHRHVIDSGTFRASGKQRAAIIIMGGTAKKHGPAFGAEFGALRWPQFPPWKGNDENAGYMLYPTIREQQAEWLDVYWTELEALFSDAFPD